MLDPHQLGFQIIEDWLASCYKYHGGNCDSFWTEELLEIKLVDVETRKIVQAPIKRFDYLALSYVWGGVRPKSYQVGSQLEPGELSQTIKDAMKMTKDLQQRYLWVDALCIDQADNKDKAQQIERMGNIYRGATFTIVALSGTSANSGLPRLNGHGKMHPQISCHVEGQRLVGLMPTLSQQIWRSSWGTRAWT
ncbi:HET-domain-containing protein, partial [Microthyrium microscopicum]